MGKPSKKPSKPVSIKEVKNAKTITKGQIKEIPTQTIKRSKETQASAAKNATIQDKKIVSGKSLDNNEKVKTVKPAGKCPRKTVAEKEKKEIFEEKNLKEKEEKAKELEEKEKHVKEIIKKNLETHKKAKEEEKLAKEKLAQDKKKKQDLIEDINSRAKDALKEAKFKAYEPTGKWGVDERNFRQVSSKEKQSENFQREHSEKAKREYREKVKQEGRARIGLEILDMYPELLQNRGKSSENHPSTTAKTPKPRNPEIAEWMKQQKLKKKQQALQAQMIEKEQNEKRLKVLKELELIAKPQKKPQQDIEKRQNIMKRIKSKADDIRKSRPDSSARSYDSSEMRSGKKTEGIDFVVDKDKFDLSMLNKDKSNDKSMESKNSIGKKKLKMNIDSFDKPKDRPTNQVSLYSEDYDEEKFETPSSERKLDKDRNGIINIKTKGQKIGKPKALELDSQESSEKFRQFNEEDFDEDEEKKWEFDEEEEGEFDEEEGEFDEEEEGEFDEEEGELDEEEEGEFDEEEEGEFDEEEGEYEGEGEDQSEEYKEKLFEVNKDRKLQKKGLESFPKIQQPADTSSNPRSSPNDLPGNSKVLPGFDKYSVHPYASKIPNSNLPVPIQNPPQAINFSANSPPSPLQKESIRARLADLHNRVDQKAKNLNQKVQKDLKPKEESIKNSVSDDFDVDFYKIPGILAADEQYQMNKVFTEVQIYRAASKIQALVKGYLTRKNLIRIQHNIPSNKQINKDIHGILLKYYPEAYVPDFFTSSAIPESISLAKSSLQIKEVGTSTIPVKVNTLITPIFKQNDEYNLVEILARENLLIQPEESLQAESFDTEEVYSEEFDSESGSQQSLVDKKRKMIRANDSIKESIYGSNADRVSESIRESIYGSRAHDHGSESIKESIYMSRGHDKGSDSIKESIFASKGFDKSSKSKYMTGSIQESIEEEKNNYKIPSAKALEKPTRFKKMSGSIQESIAEYSSEVHSIPESLSPDQKSKKYSGTYRQSEIGEDIESYKRTGSVKFADEDMVEGMPSHRTGIRQSKSDIYEDDFESGSSSRKHLEKHLPKLGKDPVLGKLPDFTPAKELENKLIYGLDALERARVREYELDTLINQKKQKLEEEAIRQHVFMQKNHEIFLQEIKNEKSENLQRFEYFMQAMLKQQQDYFSQLASVISTSLQNNPIVIREQQIIVEEKASVPKLSLPVKQESPKPVEKNHEKPQNVQKQPLKTVDKPKPVKVIEKIKSEDSISEDFEAPSSSRQSDIKSSDRKYPKKVSYESPESSNIKSSRDLGIKSSYESIEEDIYESQFESPSESSSSRKVKGPGPVKAVAPKDKIQVSHESIKEDISESQYSKSNESSQIKGKIISKKFAESSEESDVYESNFDSYHSSSSKIDEVSKPQVKIEESIAESLYENEYDSHGESLNKSLESKKKSPSKKSESSIQSEIYESQFDSYHESSSKDKFKKLVPISKNLDAKSSEESEIYESQFDSYHESTSKDKFKVVSKPEEKKYYESSEDSESSGYIGKSYEKNKSKKLSDTEEDIYDSQFDSYKESSSKKVNKKTFEDSEEDYDSHLESYNGSGSKKLDKVLPKKERISLDKSSIGESIEESHLSSYHEELAKSLEKSLPLPKEEAKIQTKPQNPNLIPTSLPEKQDFIEESIQEEFYDSQFESYHSSKHFPKLTVNSKELSSSGAHVPISPGSSESPSPPLKANEIFISSDQEDSRRSIPRLSIPNRSPDPESRFSQHKSSDFSESMHEDIAESIYSEDFESERSDKRSNNLSQRSASGKQSGNYHKNPQNFNAKFPVASESYSSNLSSPHKSSARSRKSPDLRSSTSSISEDLDIYDSFSKQSVNFESSLRRSASLHESAKNSKAESSYSEDFESESRSFRPAQSYGSDFEGSHGESKNLKALRPPIKEVSPEDSESHEISESVHDTENDYSEDFNSESNSKKLASEKTPRSARSDSKDAEASGKKIPLEDIQEEGKSEDIELDKINEITEELFELIKEDALQLLYGREVNDMVEELYTRIISDCLRLVPNKKIFVNDTDYLSRTINKFISSLNEEPKLPTQEQVIENFMRDTPIKNLGLEIYSDFLPNTTSEYKKTFKSMHKAIKDSITTLSRKCVLSIVKPMKGQTEKTIIKDTVSKWVGRKMGMMRPCISQEERKMVEIQRENTMKEVVDEEINETNDEWLNQEKYELRIVAEVETDLLDLLINEIHRIL